MDMSPYEYGWMDKLTIGSRPGATNSSTDDKRDNDTMPTILLPLANDDNVDDGMKSSMKKNRHEHKHRKMVKKNVVMNYN